MFASLSTLPCCLFVHDRGLYSHRPRAQQPPDMDDIGGLLLG
jgi:hypothetical protein